MKQHLLICTLLTSSLFQYCLSMDHPDQRSPLNAPAISGDLEEITRLLDAGIPLDDEYNRALHNAARYGHVEVLKLLLSRDADPNKRTKDYLGLPPAFLSTPLEMMSTHLHVRHATPDLNTVKSAVQELVYHGADPNMADIDGNTPLHTCAKFFNSEYKAIVAEALLENGANPFLKNNDGQTPRESNSSLSTDKMLYVLQEGEKNWKQRTQRIRMILRGAPYHLRKGVRVRKATPQSAQASSILWGKPLPTWDGGKKESK